MSISENELAFLATALMIGSTEGVVEAQEARGQNLACGNGQVVWLGFEDDEGYRGDALRVAQALGFTFTGRKDEKVNAPLLETVLPPGWTMKPTNHSMWSHVLDDKGRVRFAAFYKAAFYDLSAHVRVQRCVTINMESMDEGKKVRYVVKNDATGAVVKDFPWRDRRDYDTSDADRKDAVVFLEENYPDHEDPLAYWS